MQLGKSIHLQHCRFRSAIKREIATGLDDFDIQHVARGHHANPQYNHHAVAGTWWTRPVLLHQVMNDRRVSHDQFRFRFGKLACIRLLLSPGLRLGLLLTLSLLLGCQLQLPLLLRFALLLFALALLFRFALLLLALELLLGDALLFSPQSFLFLLALLCRLLLLRTTLLFLTLTLGLSRFLSLTLLTLLLRLALLQHALIARLRILVHQQRLHGRRSNDVDYFGVRLLKIEQRREHRTVQQDCQHDRKWITVENRHSTNELFQWFRYQIGTCHSGSLQYGHQTDERAVAALAITLHKHLNLGIRPHDSTHLFANHINGNR